MKKLKTFILKCTLELKLSSVMIKYWIMIIVQYLIMLGMSIFLDRLLECIVMIPSFFAFTKLFTRQYHCKTLLKCSITTIIIYTLVFIILPTDNCSALVSILLSYCITLTSYFVRKYLDYIELLNKSLENLTFDEMCQKFSKYDRQTLRCVYEYLNRGNISADNIAMKYFYSTRQIQRIIRKMRTEM